MAFHRNGFASVHVVVERMFHRGFDERSGDSVKRIFGVDRESVNPRRFRQRVVVLDRDCRHDFPLHLLHILIALRLLESHFAVLDLLLVESHGVRLVKLHDKADRRVHVGDFNRFVVMGAINAN